jgi:hypothetical protein
VGRFESPADYGRLHNEWSDRVLANTALIRDDELRERAEAAGYMIFLATLARQEYVTYAVLRGVLDVHEWLEHWLRREDPPPAHLPRMDEIRQLVGIRGGTMSLDPLNDLLQNRA